MVLRVLPMLYKVGRFQGYPIMLPTEVRGQSQQR